MSTKDSEWVPPRGQWPVDPQEDVPISKNRIWIDGCFDFSHHGHAGAMLQARRLGKELVVGIHSDEAILENKGPTVMTLQERVAAVNACRWSSSSVPCAPYVTSLPWISHYGCYYVVHGDDITSDSSGEDCYRFVKAAGRFLVVKRTPGISTTDLVSRMLLLTKDHFIKSLSEALAGEGGHGAQEAGQELKQRFQDFASDETGLRPGSEVWIWSSLVESSGEPNEQVGGHLTKVTEGKRPRPGQRVVYVDGGFDLFSSGHIEFLRLVHRAEEEVAVARGWYEESARLSRLAHHEEDYGPVFVLAGIHDDRVINQWKGANYPIMNIVERGLCVLQCRYIHLVVFSAPFTPTEAYLNALPYGIPQAVYHGPTAFMPATFDPYSAPRKLGIYRQIGEHGFRHVNSEEIVQRILRSREMYEGRQRAKGVKAIAEEAAKTRQERGGNESA